MKTLEANSIRTGKTDGEMVGIDILSKILARTHKRGAGSGGNRYHLIQEIRKAAPVRSTAF